MDSICLTVDEIRELTGRKRPSSQHEALADMRIPARLRPNNTVCVLRADLMPAAASARPNRETDEPDFSGLRRGTA